MSGTRPDVVDGSAWAGLSAYVFRETQVPPFPPTGRLGTMTEVTIEILTVDDAGRRGIVYRTVDTDHVPQRMGIPGFVSAVRFQRHSVEVAGSRPPAPLPARWTPPSG